MPSGARYRTKGQAPASLELIKAKGMDTGDKTTYRLIHSLRMQAGRGCVPRDGKREGDKVWRLPNTYANWSGPIPDRRLVPWRLLDLPNAPADKLSEFRNDFKRQDRQKRPQR